jgi:DNA-binding response OmpR family regulator
VDDDPVLSRALSVALQNAGYATAVANSAEAALLYASQHAMLAAIVDIHLPDLHGLVLTQKLRERLGDSLPILVLSGDSSISILNSLTHAGATYFFKKPVDSKILLERLASLLSTNVTKDSP